jgi:hypothetical protein
VLLRDKKYLDGAAESLRSSNPACPEALAKECTRLYEAIQSVTPTVVFGVSDGHGNDLVDVTVTVDGTVVRRKLDGLAVPLDPGVHLVRFESKGLPSAEERIALRGGDKDRVITEVLARLTLPPPAKAPVAVAAPLPSVPSPTDAHGDGESRRTSFRNTAIASGLIGAAGMAVFGGLWAQAMGDFRKLQAQCGPPPHCSASTVNGDRSNAEFTGAYVGLGFGVAGLALGATFTIVTLSTGGSNVVRATPTLGGARIEATF